MGKIDLSEQITQTKGLIKLNRKHLIYNYFLCVFSFILIAIDMNSAYLTTRIPILFFINGICAMYMGYVFFKSIKGIKADKEIDIALKSLLKSFELLHDISQKPANENNSSTL